MITVVQDYNAAENADLLRDMFALRARVFRDRLGWDVTVQDGLERDDLDDEGPVYLIHADKDRQVAGSCRLLPTTGATLISSFFRDTMPDAAELRAPSIWECTRFCVDEEALGDPAAATRICGELLTRIGVVALASGITTIVANIDASSLRAFRRIGCRVDILGSTSRFGSPVYLGAFPISHTSVANGLSRFPASITESEPATDSRTLKRASARVEPTRAGQRLAIDPMNVGRGAGSGVPVVEHS